MNIECDFSPWNPTSIDSWSCQYVPYIRFEKVKIHSYLNGLPQSYQDRIELYESIMLEDTIEKAKYFYKWSKHKDEFWSNWKRKEKTVLGGKDQNS